MKQRRTLGCSGLPKNTDMRYVVDCNFAIKLDLKSTFSFLILVKLSSAVQNVWIQNKDIHYPYGRLKQNLCRFSAANKKIIIK